MFCPTSIAKSPRIEPGAASSGFVAPMSWRAALTASWPSRTSGDERAAGDEVHELAEERPLGVLGVVRLGRVARRDEVLEGDDLQALALEAGDDLAGEAPREGVGLDEDEGAFHAAAP